RSREIEKQDLAAAVARQSQRALVEQGGAVAGGERRAVEAHVAARHLQPGVAPGPEGDARTLPGRQARGVEIDVLMERQTAVASIRRGDQAQLALPLRSSERLLLVARRQSDRVGHDPDLQEM